MRYFKHKHPEKTEKNAAKAYYADALPHEKKLLRRGKVLTTLANVLFFSIFGFCFICLSLAIKQIPRPDDIFPGILSFIGTLILRLAAIVICFIIGALAAIPILNKAYVNRHEMKKNVLSQACAHLREYYELTEPCLVTKCYESSDKRFTNHDVCIFVVGDELRITANLKHGFFHGRNDLGCYAFKADEITVSKKEGEHFLIAELKADNTFFLFGYRAKSFIEGNFLAKEQTF